MVAPATDPQRIQQILDVAVSRARGLEGGEPATYIPELANADLNQTSAAVVLCNGSTLTAGDAETHRFTLQSSAKTMQLAGLLQDRGEAEVFGKVGREPSGGSFASIGRLETVDKLPANPLINAGAIALASLLRGNLEDRLAWLDGWIERLYGRALHVNNRVLASERRTGDKNRAIAYVLKANGVLDGEVDEVLETYFSKCSYEGGVADVARFAATLATEGVVPGTRRRVLGRREASVVVSLMATCGMYDESGTYLAATGLPAKSGVSGVIMAVAPGRAGIAVASPRINAKGGSVRGHAILRDLSRELNWHFASPGNTILDEDEQREQPLDSGGGSAMLGR